jgi:hypothetical protein
MKSRNPSWENENCGNEATPLGRKYFVRNEEKSMGKISKTI